MVCLCMLKVNNSGDFNLKCFKINLVCYGKALLVLHTRFLSYERFFKGGKMVVYPISPSPPTPMLTKNWKEDQILQCSNHFFRQKPLQRKYLFQITNVFFLNHYCILSLLNRVPCLPYVPRQSTCQRAKTVPTSYFYAPTCQRAKGEPIFQFGEPTCQEAYHLFELCLPKGVRIFQLFFKRIFLYTLYIYT